MPNYQTADPNLWNWRPDAQPNEYFGQLIQCINLEQDKLDSAQFGLVGFASDLGVQKNFGRVGAKLAPTVIRQFLARLTINNPGPIYDCGDILVANHESLLAGQRLLATKIGQLLTTGITPIVLGGGHETAYGHYLGLAAALTEPIAILNFDAHFDLRQVSPDNEGNSGTPFRQIYNDCLGQQRPFNYYCVGIQPRANVSSMYQFAASTGCKFLAAHTVNQQPQLVTEFISEILSCHKLVYVTICLDVFQANFAPGVSAPQVLGIDPIVVFNALQQLKHSQQVVSLDIAELNPNYDIDNHTARLAANLIAEFIN